MEAELVSKPHTSEPTAHFCPSIITSAHQWVLLNGGPSACRLQNKLHTHNWRCGLSLNQLPDNWQVHCVFWEGDNQGKANREYWGVGNCYFPLGDKRRCRRMRVFWTCFKGRTYRICRRIQSRLGKKQSGHRMTSIQPQQLEKMCNFILKVPSAFFTQASWIFIHLV